MLELGAPYDAVLSLRQSRDHGVRAMRVKFPIDMTFNFTRVRHAGRLAAGFAPDKR